MKPAIFTLKKLPFWVQVALVATLIVVMGLMGSFWTHTLSGQATPDPVASDKALNDTRSPLAAEIPIAAQTPPPIPTVPNPATATESVALGTDSPFALPSESTYPQENLSTKPHTPTANVPSTPANTPSREFGHLPYRENTSQLVNVGPFVRENYERDEALDHAAAGAFMLMQRDAAQAGVQLMAISGFRSIADQKELFTKQIERKGSEAAAAQYSAPPGHSEHHTGYAVDIADINEPDTDIKLSFEYTAAYQWLVSNAAEYGFEESFPKNNAQGVSFEPWHWRYVGTPEALATFNTARSLFPAPSR